MPFVIEKNVPIPADARIPAAGGSKPKYPFADLEVNDSFFIPGKTKLNSTIAGARDRLGRLFTSQVETVNGVEGTRIWRVEGEAPIKTRKAKVKDQATPDAAPEAA